MGWYVGRGSAGMLNRFGSSGRAIRCFTAVDTVNGLPL